MPRTYVEPSWNGAAAPPPPGKPAKPLPPLRYRISPTEKKLDELDALDDELKREWAAGNIEREELEYYEDVLATRRNALGIVVSKAAGEEVERPGKATVSKEPRSKATPTPVVVYKSYGAAVFTIILIFFYFFVWRGLTG